jgi:hypothetical protein
MTNTKRPPINLQLSRFTPVWAKSRAARRLLVLTMYTAPLLSLLLLSLTQSDVWRIPAALPMLCYPVCLLWLMGATQARADLPDDYLDEREIAQRNEVFLNAFRWLMGLVALAYLLTTYIPAFDNQAPSQIIGLLFAAGLPLPTATLAWVQPDPPTE